VQAGKRDRLVIIQKPTSSQTVGEPVRTWPTHSTWWARKRALGGSEGPAGGQEQYGIQRHEWDGLWIDGVTSEMRLNDGGILYDIDVVDDTGKRENVLRLITTQRGA